MSKVQFQVAQSQTPSPELLSWVISQLQVGCRPDDVLAAMRSSGWQDAVGLKALEQAHAHRLVNQAVVSADGLPAAAPVPEPDLKTSPSTLWAGDREVQGLMTLGLPRVGVFGNFLSHQ